MNGNYTLSEFETALFDYDVASIQISEKNFQSLSQIIQKMKAGNVRLAYLQLPSVTEVQAQVIVANGGKLVDEKVHIKWQLSALQAQNTMKKSVRVRRFIFGYDEHILWQKRGFYGKIVGFFKNWMGGVW
ncbi:MAG: hypothetical protein HKM04_11555 [Legionellales bacterium]|nr:hypothetical protein [Legionellales bacterium]